ncbi:hypothetical protein HRbin36_01972 [bacterium HR36]|nr:hypothetical protein HRbin36_01972 [bacterium HR36]
MTRHSWWGIALAVGVMLASVAWADKPPPSASPERIAQLIRQLGAPSFAEREKASQALEAIGEAALPALQEAAEKSDDLEVKRRAADLVRVIEARLAAEKLRQPTLVSVAYHNTPVAEVLKDLTAKTGVPMQLQVAANREGEIRQKLVTLRLDQKPLWEVVDQVLAACSLRQAEPTSSPVAQMFFVEEGTLDRSKVCYSGAARIRWLTKSPVARKPVQPNTPAMEAIALEICVEPQRFLVDGQPAPISVQLLDEKGQAISANTQLIPQDPSQSGQEEPAGIVVVPAQGGQVVAQIQVNARIIAPGLRPRESRWRVLADLIIEKDELNKAASIRGQLDCRVLVRDELVIANPLQAERKVYGEPSRFQVRLLEASQQGQQVKVILETTSVAQAPGGPVNIPQILSQNEGVRLFDDNDQVCTVTQRGISATQVAGNNVLSWQMNLTFLLPKATAKPARLVILNHTPTTLTLPFQFALTSR